MPKPTVPSTTSSSREYTENEGREIFDKAARRHLGISGEEFLRCWDAGEFADDPDRPEVIEVAMMIPLVR